MGLMNLRSQWLVRSACAAAMLALAACGGSEDDSAAAAGASEDDEEAVEYTVNGPSAIAQASAASYDNNINGLITGATLKSWMDDWTANRPAGITGNLVILQASVGETGAEYIAPDGTNVFTYAVDSSEWVETRSNGVTKTISMVPSGATMDAFLAKYGIDPSADMIVCAQGSAGGGSVMRAGRCWYNFRYWGTPKENLAVLDGGNQWNVTNKGLAATSAGSTPPEDGTATVKDLAEINVALQATLEDVLNASTSGNTAVFIWDARSADEYNGVQYKTKATGETCGADGASQCYTALEGHPAGAVNLEYSELLDTTAGYTYKDKATLAGLVGGAGYTAGQTIYTYCRTTFRAMASGIAAGVVLGYPVRFYDGAMIEWLQMAHYLNKTGSYNVEGDSPWRTDDVAATASMAYNANTSVEAPIIIDPYAESADAIIVADKAYKTGGGGDSVPTDDSGDDSDGGTTLPPNPCG